MNNNIKNSKSIRIAAALSFAAVAAIGTAYGGVPLNNLQGAGGIAFGDSLRSGDTFPIPRSP